MIERRCAATTTLEDLVTMLKIAETLGELQVETDKIWISICPDATALWHTSVTKIAFFVNRWASGCSAAGDIHKSVMLACMDGPDDATWLQALDEDVGLNAQINHRRKPKGGRRRRGEGWVGRGGGGGEGEAEGIKPKA